MNDDKILPQDFLFEDTRCSVRVQTTVAKELIDEKLLIPHIRKGGLGVGTVIKVQVMAKGYDRGERTGVLLHSTDFVIERAIKERRMVIDDRGEMVREIWTWSVVQDSEWKSYVVVPEEISAPVSEREPESYVPGEAEAKWNPGLKTYEIKIGDKVLATERDKERALAMAAGSVPLAA